MEWWFSQSIYFTFFVFFPNIIASLLCTLTGECRLNLRWPASWGKAKHGQADVIILKRPQVVVSWAGIVSGCLCMGESVRIPGGFDAAAVWKRECLSAKIGKIRARPEPWQIKWGRETGWLKAEWTNCERVIYGRKHGSDKRRQPSRVGPRNRDLLLIDEIRWVLTNEVDFFFFFFTRIWCFMHTVPNIHILIHMFTFYLVKNTQTSMIYWEHFGDRLNKKNPVWHVWFESLLYSSDCLLLACFLLSVGKKRIPTTSYHHHHRVSKWAVCVQGGVVFCLWSKRRIWSKLCFCLFAVSQRWLVANYKQDFQKRVLSLSWHSFKKARFVNVPLTVVPSTDWISWKVKWLWRHLRGEIMVQINRKWSRVQRILVDSWGQINLGNAVKQLNVLVKAPKASEITACHSICPVSDRLRINMWIRHVSFYSLPLGVLLWLALQNLYVFL